MSLKNFELKNLICTAVYFFFIIFHGITRTNKFHTCLTITVHDNLSEFYFFT